MEKQGKKQTKQNNKTSKNKDLSLKARKTKLLLILLFILIFILFEMNYLMLRAAGPRQIDDVHPNAGCSMKYLKKSDILWVIPEFKNIPITSNKTWCEQIKNLNKTIGLHGMKHTWKEFSRENITKDELEESISLVEECFNQTPTMFKPPHLTLSPKNKKLLEQYNFTIKKRFNQLTNKIYHCNSSGLFTNEFIDAF
ncbi:DUF2334 domain-containing protein [Candidatus Pacearchaeota archaeon]|nr:DUF2334 domain-containing protein [Candidatus Pacearchaeota archaeon]